MPENTKTAFAAAWPADVIARYLTVAGATFDLFRRDASSNYISGGRCTGCTHSISWMEERFGREKAQSHAETCRALPRPPA